jgi:hypothetical protein
MRWSAVGCCQNMRLTHSISQKHRIIIDTCFAFLLTSLQVLAAPDVDSIQVAGDGVRLP